MEEQGSEKDGGIENDESFEGLEDSGTEGADRKDGVTERF